MNAVASTNLVGITGIARRLVLDGALDEATAREALDKATRERKPVATWLRDHRAARGHGAAGQRRVARGRPGVVEGERVWDVG